MTSMVDRYPNYIICGSQNGDLHFVKLTALFYEKDFIIENIQLNKMCLGKSYAAHASFLNQIEY